MNAALISRSTNWSSAEQEWLTRWTATQMPISASTTGGRLKTGSRAPAFSARRPRPGISRPVRSLHGSVPGQNAATSTHVARRHDRSKRKAVQGFPWTAGRAPAHPEDLLTLGFRRPSAVAPWSGFGVPCRRLQHNGNHLLTLTAPTREQPPKQAGTQPAPEAIQAIGRRPFCSPMAHQATERAEQAT